MTHPDRSTVDSPREQTFKRIGVRVMRNGNTMTVKAILTPSFVIIIILSAAIFGFTLFCLIEMKLSLVNQIGVYFFMLLIVGGWWLLFSSAYNNRILFINKALDRLSIFKGSTVEMRLSNAQCAYFSPITYREIRLLGRSHTTIGRHESDLCLKFRNGNVIHLLTFAFGEYKDQIDFQHETDNLVKAINDFIGIHEK